MTADGGFVGCGHSATMTWPDMPHVPRDKIGATTCSYCGATITCPAARAVLASERVDPFATSLEYASLGWAAMPLHHPTRIEPTAECSCRSTTCGSIGKHPVLSGWQQRASHDPDTVTAWRNQWPDHNIGLPTGRHFDALDLDGDEAVAVVEKISGALGQPLGNGPVAETGKGLHHLFLPTGHGNAQGIWPGIDWRGIGGYIVGSPSLHPSGRRYRWIDGRSPWDVELEAAPPFVVDQLDRSCGPRTSVLVDLDDFQLTGKASTRLIMALETDWNPDALVRAVTRAVAPHGRASGNRNSILFWAACRVLEAHALHRCTTAEANVTLSRLRIAAMGRGLDERSVDRTINSARRRAQR